MEVKNLQFVKIKSLPRKINPSTRVRQISFSSESQYSNLKPLKNKIPPLTIKEKSPPLIRLTIQHQISPTNASKIIQLNRQIVRTRTLIKQKTLPNNNRSKEITRLTS